jgi:hypothetical protein
LLVTEASTIPLPTDPESQIDAPTTPYAPGAITSELEFVAALRARREELGLSYETIEAITGMAEGSANKCLSGRKPIGALYQWLILEALGLNVRLEENPQTTAKIRNRSDWKRSRQRSAKKTWGLREIALSRRRNAPWLFSPETAAAAGRKSAAARKAKREAARATIVAA